MTHRLTSGRDVIEALIAAGIASEYTTRVVLDVQWDGLVTAYVQSYPDRRVLDVVRTLTGDNVVFAEREGQEGNGGSRG